jgi:hypothetical protein
LLLVRGASPAAAAAKEIRVSQLLRGLFEAGTAAFAGLTAAAATAVAAARTITTAATLALPSAAITALASALVPARDARVGWSGFAWGLAVLGGQTGNADNRVLGAAAEQAAAFTLIEHEEFHLIDAGSEFCERPVTGVFDGFAVCFGLIHSCSSIHEQG